MRAVPTYFGGALRLFGWLHAPAEPEGGKIAAVLCNPAGREQVQCHRFLRNLANSLAIAGVPTLRFDYPGTGDSGDESGADTIHAWLDSIGDAMEFFTRRRAVDLCLFGIRLGATLAAAAAAESGVRPRGLVLWNPFPNGRAFGRETAIGERLTGGAPAAPVSGLERLDLLAMRELPAGSVLLLAPPGSGSEPAAVRHFRLLGAEIWQDPAAAYARTMAPPPGAQISQELIAMLAAWISGLPGRERTLSPDFGDVRSEGACVGGAVREEPLQLPRPRRIFGILAAPTGPVAHAPGVLLINSGTIDHVGPNRLYVRLAREWAAAGFRVFRFDLSGLGDSEPGRGCEENGLYPSEAIADVQSVMDTLGPSHGLERFVLTGICFGAQVAVQTAVRDPRVIGVQAVNAPSLGFDHYETVAREAAEYADAAHHRRALLRAGSWAKFARGRASARPADVLAALWAPVRDRRGPAGSSPAGAADRSIVEELVRKGISPVLVYSPGEKELHYFRLHLEQACAKWDIAAEIVPGADHLFSRAEPQNTLVRLLTAGLAEIVAAHA